MNLNPEIFLNRRRGFMSRMEPGSVAVFFSAPPANRSHDVDYSYRQDSYFFYLTGFTEEESILILTNEESCIYVRKRDIKKETWYGYRTGVKDAPALLLTDKSADTDDFRKDLPEILKNKDHLYYFFGSSADKDRMMMETLSSLRRRVRAGDTAPSHLHHPGFILDEMRLFKSPEEISLLRTAAQITSEAHIKAIQAAKPGMSEYEIEALFQYEFRRNGGWEAYPSIIASGRHACILHYIHNNDTLKNGDLVLMDAGAEYGYQSADISRTFPVSPSFTPAQYKIYTLVLEAQKRAIAACRPGATLEAVHETVNDFYLNALTDLGFLKGSPEKIKEDKLITNFYMHKTGHWLGMDVHDRGAYYKNRESRPLEKGMVFTVEPGLYISPLLETDPDLPPIPPEFLGIGVRIEDDVLITEKGCEVLTAQCPKEPDDILALRR